ncbi:hypothetical protein F4782DRAFT_64031 [Xylaria castorea]|nr:hypothetical protein F4782DRAFT_64031 [Xylaria castorea]
MEQSQAYYETPGHVISAAVALSILDIVVVMLRFWTRKSRNQGLETDDWLILPATISTVAIGASMIYGVTQEALGYRTKVPPAFAGDPFDITTYQLTTTSKIEFAYGILLPLTLGFVKSSFLFFYMRIFSVDKKGWTNILLVGLVVFVVLWAIAFSLALVFGCGLDVEAHWGSTHDLETKCKGSMTVVLVLCITDFAADVAIIAIPVPLVWGLNLSIRNKVAICAVFLLGSVTVAASLTRLIIEGRAVAIGFAPGSDSILVITEYIYWGFVECAVAILSACLPTLHGLISHHKILAWPKRFVRSLSKDELPSPTKFAGRNEIPLAPMTPIRLVTTGTDSIYADPTPGLRSMKSETPLIRADAVASTQTRSTEEV